MSDDQTVRLRETLKSCIDDGPTQPMGRLLWRLQLCYEQLASSAPERLREYLEHRWFCQIHLKRESPYPCSCGLAELLAASAQEPVRCASCDQPIPDHGNIRE